MMIEWLDAEKLKQEAETSVIDGMRVGEMDRDDLLVVIGILGREHDEANTAH